MWRRSLHLARTALVALSLIASAALAAVSLESHRHTYAVIRDSVRETQTEWWPSRCVAEVKGSSLCIWHTADEQTKTVLFPGPLGETREIPVPRPTEGWFVEVSPADPAWDSGINPGDVRWRFGNLAWVVGPGPSPIRMAVIALWPLVVVAAIGPVLWAAGRIGRSIARRRASAGLCPACGYDLRASTTRCPECGRDSAEETECRPGGWRRWAWAFAAVTCAIAVMSGVMVAAIMIWGPAGGTGGITPYGAPVP